MAVPTRGAYRATRWQPLFIVPSDSEDSLLTDPARRRQQLGIGRVGADGLSIGAEIG
jgi:hypothetical protein